MFDWAWIISKALNSPFPQGTKYMSFVIEFPFLTGCNCPRGCGELDKIMES
jgi:hypothetical protein